MTSEPAVYQEYINANRKNVVFIVLFTLLAIVSFFITLGFGIYKISIVDAVGVFFDHLRGNITNPDADYYVWQIRVPRALGAIITGASLAVAGAVMQNDFKNPLAEPYTMGISSGAFLGAVLSIIFGISLIPFVTGSLATVVNAFILSLVPTGMIVVISRFKKMSPTMMILTGLAVMFLFSSISQVIMVTAPSETLADAYAWRVGDVGKVFWSALPLMSVSSVTLIVLVYTLAGKMNVMYAGDTGAKTLGERADIIRIVTLILISFLTASVVCFTGTIGFIGLVGPHVARIFVGSNNRYLIPASASFGAAFILLADTLAKVSGANGLPVGVISSMVGGPLFIWILIKQRRSAWA